MHEIRLLEPRLANQIAAGEVVERPASVVKELVENALDAGASRIEVELERGGIRLIRVADNGHGIAKEQLKLALTRHATSKLKSSEDLAAIGTLGFRGEALASIASVSRLMLTSRPHEQNIAWQAIAEGVDMQVEVEPAAAQPGTRVDVRDLFFNTPARQKFLRSERTEFNRVEAVLKQFALAFPQVAFLLKHNGKVVKRYPAVGEEQMEKRLVDVCGTAFAKAARFFSCNHEHIQLKGWVTGSEFHRSEADLQFIFINARPVKDRTLAHAIRQAYQGQLPEGRSPGYVLFLNMDLSMVDVNVHPTKHEVRFREQRLVHDLLASALREVLEVSDSSDKLIAEDELAPMHQTTQISEASSAIYKAHMGSQNSSRLRPVAAPIGNNYGNSAAAPEVNSLQAHTHVAVNEQSQGTQEQLANGAISVGEGYTLCWQRPPLLIAQPVLYEHLTRQAKVRQLNRIKLLFPRKLVVQTESLEDAAFFDWLQNLGYRWLNTRHNLKLMAVPQWARALGAEAQEGLFRRILVGGRIPDGNGLYELAVSISSQDNLSQCVPALLQELELYEALLPPLAISLDAINWSDYL